MGIWLFFNSVAVIIKSVYILFGVINDHKYIKVFKFFAHLSARAYIAVLLKSIYIYNIPLLKVLSYFIVTVFYKIFIEFLFRLL